MHRAEDNSFNDVRTAESAASPVAKSDARSGSTYASEDKYLIGINRLKEDPHQSKVADSLAKLDLCM